MPPHDAPIIARTDRLVLREFVEADAPAFADLLADLHVMRFSLDGPLSPERARRWFDGVLRHYRLHGYSIWAVTPADDGACVLGYCGVIDQVSVEHGHEYEIGYRLFPRYWGHGYATEAAAAARDAAFDRIDTDHLIAMIDPANTASIRVATKIGMTHRRDVVLPGFDHPDHVYAIDRPTA